jgi:hypothetical protein
VHVGYPMSKGRSARKGECGVVGEVGSGKEDKRRRGDDMFISFKLAKVDE